MVVDGVRDLRTACLPQHLSLTPLMALPQPRTGSRLQLQHSLCSFAHPRRHESRQQLRRRVSWLTPRRTQLRTAADVDASALFTELASEHCVPPINVSLARTPEGLGWVLNQKASRLQVATRSSRATGTAAGARRHVDSGAEAQHQQQQQDSETQQPTVDPEAQQPTVVIRVPLRLCLSHEVPGCCPAAHSSRALAPVLSCTDESAAPWEVVLAALLVWAWRQPEAGSGAAGEGAGDARSFAHFWRRYRALLPSATQQTSLTFWREEELQQLQVCRVGGGSLQSMAFQEAMPCEAECRTYLEEPLILPPTRTVLPRTPTLDFTQAIRHSP